MRDDDGFAPRRDGFAQDQDSRITRSAKKRSNRKERRGKARAKVADALKAKKHKHGPKCKAGFCPLRKTPTGEYRLADLDAPARGVLADVARLTKPGVLVTQKMVVAKSGKSTSRVSRLLEVLQVTGFVNLIPGTYPKAYELTSKGRTAAVAVVSEGEVLRGIGGPDANAQNPAGQSEESRASLYPIRLHDVQFQVPLHRRPDHDELLRTGWVFDQSMKWPRYSGFVVQGVSVNLHPDKIIVYLPPLMAESPQQALEKAYLVLRDVLDEFQRRYPKIVLGEPHVASNVSRVQAKIAKQQHAVYGDEYAKILKAERKSVRTDRVEVDSSVPGVPETEFVHKEKAPADAEKYVDFIHQVIEGRWEHVLPAMREAILSDAVQRRARIETEENLSNLSRLVLAMEVRRENEELKEFVKNVMQNNPEMLNKKVFQEGKGPVRDAGGQDYFA